MLRSEGSLTLALLMAIVVSGCGRSGDPTGPGGSTAADEAEVLEALAAAPEVVDEPIAESEEATAASATTGFNDDALAAIRPYRFWRRITDVDRRFTFAFSDSDSTGRPTRAVVTVHRTLRGTFNLLAGPPPAADPAGSPDSTRRLVQKRLFDRAVRRILLVRVPEPWRARSAWRVAATSGVEVTSDPRADAPVIQSVRVVTANLDTTIADPLAFWFLRRIPRLEANSRVRVVVTTAAEDDAVFLMRLGHRFRLENQGGGIHAGEFTIGDEPGLRHAAVNALSNGTLFDDAAPYQSNAWVLPYAVRAEELAAEYRP